MATGIDVRSARPTPQEFPGPHAHYVARVPDGDVLAVLEAQPAELERVLGRLPAEKETFRYAPGKWSVREVVGHLGDGERVFGYRALSVGRGDKTSLPGFDENEWAARSGADARPLAELLADFAAARRSNLFVLRALSDTSWVETGTANGVAVSPRGLAYVMAGHVLHHLGVLRERYAIA